MLISCMLGTANFSNSSCSITIRYREDKYCNALPLVTALRSPESKLKLSRLDRNNVSRVQLAGNGAIDTAVFDAPEGSILLVDYRYSCSSIGLNKILQVRLRIREGAPLNKLKMTLPSDINAVYQYAYIDGRFDILSADEIKTQKLLRPTEFNENLLSQEKWGNLISNEQIETGYKQVVRNNFVEIKNDNGYKVAMPARRARILKLKGDKRNGTI